MALSSSSLPVTDRQCVQTGDGNDINLRVSLHFPKVKPLNPQRLLLFIRKVAELCPVGLNGRNVLFTVSQRAACLCAEWLNSSV